MLTMTESPTLNIRISQNTIILSFIYAFSVRYSAQEANTCISFMVVPKIEHYLHSINSNAIFLKKLPVKLLVNITIN